VASVAYYGDHREYEVDVSDQRLKVTTPVTLSIEHGEQVIVSCEPDEVIVMRDTVA
jgi:hypothetical protein